MMAYGISTRELVEVMHDVRWREGYPDISFNGRRYDWNLLIETVVDRLNILDRMMSE